MKLKIPLFAKPVLVAFGVAATGAAACAPAPYYYGNNNYGYQQQTPRYTNCSYQRTNYGYRQVCFDRAQNRYVYRG